ncbi:MAG: DUF5714 domain-containing protein [Candidatus Methanomethylophilus sp.]|nr:DUF5714 domain-containing protein [Methanomethylophilus sp.]MDD4221766.1 DUF5714 domain-containing protein [Methanomethylophilus sp.]
MENEHSHGCLVCGEELVYDGVPQERECVVCHRRFISDCACPHGHYVCDACHEKGGMTMARAVCLEAKDRDPLAILLRLMDLPDVHMHGPEHHILVGSALLTAYHNCTGKLDLPTALTEMARRGQQIPGGVCGFWGCCGAAISAGMFMSIVTGSTPLKEKEWSMCNRLTAQCLTRIAELGGPRCCKRDSYTAVKTAVEFTARELGVQMEMPKKIVCRFYPQNAQCRGVRCPYNPHHQ